MAHVELVVPCAPGSGAALNFATYIGDRSGWRTDERDNRAYYFGANANHWRAIPVFGAQAARRVRAACNGSEGVEYSMLRYASAASCFRGAAGLLPDGPRAPAHCATLTARMLKTAIAAVRRPSAWYGPASLFAELSEALRSREVVPSALPPRALLGEQRLLGGGDAEVRAMQEAELLEAIHALTLKVVVEEQQGDDVSRRIHQKRLANGLLRWSVNRA